MDILANVWSAIPLAFSPNVMFFMVLGVVLGIVIGALPGLSATMGIAVIIPLTFVMAPVSALGMIAGIYNGAMYGGSISAILLRIPGTPAAIATTFDGYPMAQQGRGLLALNIALVSSAIGSFVSAIVLIAVAPPISAIALKVGPAEYFWLAVFGLVAIAMILGDSMVKGLLSACLGLFCGVVGTDQVSGITRFTFGDLNLLDGINIIVFLTGLYAIPPVLEMIEKKASHNVGKLALGKGSHGFKWSSLIPTWIRASFIGVVTGATPALGGNVAAILSWNETRRADKDPDGFGKGAPKGVAASECANNADTGGSLIPMLTLGIPGNSVSAVIMGALMIHGMVPGPSLLHDNAQTVYTFMLTMLITSVLLFVIGLAGARIFINVLKIPDALLGLAIVVFTVIGTYSVNNSMFDVGLMLFFGAVGYLMDKLSISATPAVLGIILGPIAEDQFRLSLRIGHGEAGYFFQSPISMILAALVVAVIVFPLIKKLRKRSPQ